MIQSLVGRVVKGDGYGRKLGFPTANIDRRQFVRLKKSPRLGIYVGTVLINQKSKIKNQKIYKAGIVIGPIDKKGLPKLEAHLIGFTGNLYGKKLTFHLYKYLRPFTKYRGEKQLIQQIKKDISKIKQLSL